MKLLIGCLILSIPLVSAEPLTKIIPWRAACDGAEIEVVSEKGLIRSLHASAVHSRIIAGWTVHFIDGKPVSAEYREHRRGYVTGGERAGEYSGMDALMKLETWKAEKEGILIPDEARAKELREVLALARQEVPAAGASSE